MLIDLLGASRTGAVAKHRCDIGRNIVDRETTIRGEALCNGRFESLNMLDRKRLGRKVANDDRIRHFWGLDVAGSRGEGGEEDGEGDSDAKFIGIVFHNCVALVVS